VYVANLPVPLLLGWDVTCNGGRVGMAAATAPVLAVSLPVVPRWRWLRVPLVIGGVALALAQAFFVVQFMVGILSQAAVGRMGFEPGVGLGAPGHLTEPGGFVVTLLTGGPLLVVAWVCGAALWRLGRWFNTQTV
jgi:hypothetical protein